MEYNAQLWIGGAVLVALAIMPIWKSIHSYGDRREAKGKKDADIDSTLKILNDTIKKFEGVLTEHMDRYDKDYKQIEDRMKRYEDRLSLVEQIQNSQFKKQYDDRSLPK